MVHRIPVPQPGITPISPALGVWCPNHWSTKEVLWEFFLFLIYLLIGEKLHYNTLLASAAPMGVLNLLACHLLASMLQGNFTVHSLSHLISVFVLAYRILLILPVSSWTFSSFTLSLHILPHIWMGPYGKIIMSPKP